MSIKTVQTHGPKIPTAVPEVFDGAWREFTGLRRPATMRHPHVSESVFKIRRCSSEVRASVTAGLIPLRDDLAHLPFAQDRMLLAVPQGRPLTKRKTVRLRDLRDMPFVWFPRCVNPVFYDQLMQECARGGLAAPRIVQEASDRDTNLGLVQCRIGLSWQNEAVRWHCPRGIALVPVVDMKVRMPFNLIWRKGDSSPLLQKFVAQVKAL